MNKIFESVQTKKVNKNKFDLSHERKLTCDMGQLIPIYLQEILPSDSFKVKSEIFMRLAPMIAPVMHRVDVYTHFFFVPNRLVWSEWEDFITGGAQGDLVPAHPQLAIANATQSSFSKGRLADYFGLPPAEGTIGNTTAINALPFRAYLEIYNEYYRDQNLSEPINYSKGSGVESNTDRVKDQTEVRIRAWEKDYFTSALPWSQRGGAIELPIGDVTYKTATTYSPGITNPASPVLPGAPSFLGTTGFDAQLLDSGGIPTKLENIESIDSGTIEDLRKANRLQEWLEQSARTGSRYVEVLKSFFNVRSSDARLQRPEYLSGGKNPIVISEVLNQAGTEDSQSATGLQPVGQMAGHGLAMSSNHGYSKTFEEHGFVIGIMSVLPKTNYQNGINRSWNRTDKFDYYWENFAHIGEQEIQNKELFHDYNDPSTGNLTFGYQQRYAEYKYVESSVHGDFRDELDFWHLGRIFSSLPPLNEEFIQFETDNRIYAVTDKTTQHLYVQIYHQVSALRPIPYFSIPQL